MAIPVRLCSVLVLSVMTACVTASDDSDEQAGAWEAESATNETDSTHLWIVNRALDVLARHSEDPVAARAVTILNEPTCRTSWQQGLLDADYKAAYNGGRRDLPVPASNLQIVLAGTSWNSHFFDADTFENYEGEVRPTANTEANAHVQNALAIGLVPANAEACYHLGLSLHYYTDLTQPMHAANFTFKSRPLGLHTKLEAYAVEIQDRYPLDDWSGAPTLDLATWIIQTARDAKAMHAVNMQAIADAYEQSHARGTRWCAEIDRQLVDYKRCWVGNPGVDEAVGKSLREAQDHTARYIYLIAAQVPNETTAD